MTLVTSGIVLARRRYREFDRIAQIYTHSLGKVTVRFAGVDRPRGKLKALSEPLVCAEYRLYGRPSSPWLTVTGGQLVNTYPSLRASFSSTLDGLEMAEFLLRLTPEGAANAEKFDLLKEHLDALENSPYPWLVVSFGIKLLGLLGIEPELSSMPMQDRQFWVKLRESVLPSLRDFDLNSLQLNRLQSRLEHAMELYAEAPLQSRLFRTTLEPAVSYGAHREYAAPGALPAAIPGPEGPVLCASRTVLAASTGGEEVQPLPPVSRPVLRERSSTLRAA